MSYIHKLLNALLRGLVIYAVLGLECTYSNDLPSQPSDAANVATTGKRQSMSDTSVLQFIYACTLFPGFLEGGGGGGVEEAGECPAHGALM